jgi:obg-like ATPase 1
MPPAAAKPKKDKKLLLGKPSNSVKIGLVGLPNVGKSSLFNLFGGLQVPAENFPFCTIDPANTQVAVPDDRFDHLCTAFQPAKKIPAVLTVTDIAGLVKGAAEGKGLGNAFLSHIQAVDAIFHVTRAFIAKEIEHVEGTVDPIRDFQIIRGELIAKDKQWMTDHTESLKKKARAKSTKEMKEEIEVCDKVLELLNAGGEVRHGTWNGKDISFLNPYPLLTAKPVVYLVNISKQNMETSSNKWFKDIKEWVAKESPDDPVIPFSVNFEEHLLTLKPDEKKAYLEEKKVMSMMPRIIKSGYRALSLINFFTVGPDEVRSWSIRDGCKAPQAAGVIHGDFEDHFICAETYNYEDFKATGASETAVKAAGKQRTMGKEYEVIDGDIMHFKHNAGGAGKKK